MQNFALLKQVGQQSKPVMVKRGTSATIDEWLMAAEYVLAAGNPNVILCEWSIRTFDSKYTRNTLDLSAVPVLQSLTHLPIVIDPSHGTGKWQFAPATSKAAVVMNVDSLMVEVHPNPSKALSDGPQSLTFQAFGALMEELKPLTHIVGRDAPEPTVAA